MKKSRGYKALKLTKVLRVLGENTKGLKVWKLSRPKSQNILSYRATKVLDVVGSLSAEALCYGPENKLVMNTKLKDITYVRSIALKLIFALRRA